MGGREVGIMKVSQKRELLNPVTVLKGRTILRDRKATRDHSLPWGFFEQRNGFGDLRGKGIRAQSIVGNEAGKKVN